MDGGWVEPGPTEESKPFGSWGHFLLWLAIVVPICAVPFLMTLVLYWFN